MEPVLVIMGVSGSGKSTVAKALADRLGWGFAEGDALHPAENVAKMAAGIPLDDADRWPWLARVAEWIADHTRVGAPGVITCSALKRSYRDVLRGEGGRAVVFVHLAASPELLAERMNNRSGHFMPPTLLDSQLAAFEPLGADERHIEVDIGRALGVAVDEIVEALNLMPATRP